MECELKFTFHYSRLWNRVEKKGKEKKGKGRGALGVAAMFG
jgi:hypothetical protein